MSAIIEPIKNADGTVETNVQVVRNMTKILRRLRDGFPGQSRQARTKEQREFFRITNNDPEIMNWLESISRIEDDRIAQLTIEDTLLPIDSIQPEVHKISKADRLKGVR